MIKKGKNKNFVCQFSARHVFCVLYHGSKLWLKDTLKKASNCCIFNVYYFFILQFIKKKRQKKIISELCSDYHFYFWLFLFKDTNPLSLFLYKTLVPGKLQELLVANCMFLCRAQCN